MNKYTIKILPYFFLFDGKIASGDKFYDVYNIKETDRMYIRPEKRVGVW